MWFDQKVIILTNVEACQLEYQKKSKKFSASDQQKDPKEITRKFPLQYLKQRAQIETPRE